MAANFLRPKFETVFVDQTTAAKIAGFRAEKQQMSLATRRKVQSVRSCVAVATRLAKLEDVGGTRHFDGI
jgi:hypothetical protein